MSILPALSSCVPPAASPDCVLTRTLRSFLISTPNCSALLTFYSTLLLRKRNSRQAPGLGLHCRVVTQLLSSSRPQFPAQERERVVDRLSLPQVGAHHLHFAPR